MEHREDGLLVDYSGALTRNSAPGQEKELRALDQETRLMRAMNEIREYTPKSMSKHEREMFNVLVESIFRKHGVTPEVYQQDFGHLGTPQNLRR
jgi:hypothetical protein